MQLYISHPEFGVGQIQRVEEFIVHVLFPRSLSVQERQFSRRAFGDCARRYVLEGGTDCICNYMNGKVECLLEKGEGSQPNIYLICLENGDKVKVLETEFELPNIQDDIVPEEDFSPGMIVNSGDRHGFGKVLSISEGEGLCTVSFFHQPGNEEHIVYSIEALTREYLYPQTMVFVEDEGKWKIGRVIGWDRGRQLGYEVRFPGKRDKYYLETDLYVRCLSARQDPVGFMANRGFDSQFFHDARLRFVRRIVKMRNLSRGLTGVLSSSVELVEHQILAARQVLSDPVQRYVLADEVGLGKTVEAGFVIRQVLIDHPDVKVVVLAPRSLREQWETELRHKFRVDQFPNPPLILSYDEVDQLDHSDLELLVVDEAHNVFSPRSRNQAVERVALGSSRLLLLTATPVLGHERTFFNMLQVLDPGAYAEMGQDQFHERLMHKKQFGTLARMLDSATERVSPIALMQAKKLLADDMEALSLVASIEEDGGQGPYAMQATRALYRHIVERYRVYHRLIRNRRKDIQGLFLDRAVDDGLGHVRQVTIGDVNTLECMGLFEEWRQAAYEYLQSQDDRSSCVQELAKDCARLFEAVGCGVFGEELSDLIEQGRPGGQVPGVQDINQAAPARDWEGAIQLLEDAIHSVIEMKRELKDHRSGTTSIVVFTSHKSDAERFCGRFEPPNGVNIVYLNRNQEEGQNLQHAQAIIHLDIPLDPVRMEQRIGRLDRFGRKGDQVLHSCCVPGQISSHNPWGAWFDVLAQGYRIFNEPISDVQFLLEGERLVLAEALLVQGVSGIRGYCEELPDRLRLERENLDDQYALDKLLATGDGDWFTELDEGDFEEEETKEELEAWMVRALLLWGPRGDVGGKYSWDRRRTLIPEYPWKGHLGAGLDRPVTYSRLQSTLNSELDLMRLGHPLVDAMDWFRRWDTRGVAYATWRQCRELVLEEPWAGLKIEFVIEGDLQSLEGDLGRSRELAIARCRSDSFLPPWCHTVYLDLELQCVEDGALFEHMRYPHRDERVRDVNLKHRLEALDNIVAPDYLATILPQAETVGASRIKESAEYVRRVDVATALAKEKLESHRWRLRQCFNPLADISAPSSLETRLKAEFNFEEMVAQAVSSPAVRVESIGLFILSNDLPEEAK